jgi:hypothetical protein
MNILKYFFSITTWKLALNIVTCYATEDTHFELLIRLFTISHNHL